MYAEKNTYGYAKIININCTLESLQIPKCLVNYLMYTNDNIEENNQILELKFKTLNLLKSENKKITGEGPIFIIKKDKGSITQIFRNLTF